MARDQGERGDLRQHRRDMDMNMNRDTKKLRRRNEQRRRKKMLSEVRD